MNRLNRPIILNTKAEIRQPNGGALGLYINNELERPLNALEDFMAFKIEKLQLENDELKKKVQKKVQ